MQPFVVAGAGFLLAVLWFDLMFDVQVLRHRGPGDLPEPVDNLLGVARFRLLCRDAGLTEVITAGKMIRFGPADLPDSKQMRLARLYPGSRIQKATHQFFLPRPMTRPVAGQPIKDAALLAWATDAVTALLPLG